MKTYTILQRAGMALAIVALAQALSFSTHAKTRADGVMPPDPVQTQGTQAQDATTPRLVPATAIMQGGAPGGPGSAAAQGLGLGQAQGSPGQAQGVGPASAAPQGVRIGPGQTGPGPQVIGPGPQGIGIGPQGINIGPGPVRPGPQGIGIGPPQRGLQIRVWTDQNNYRVGDKMRVYFRATQDCYLYLFNTDSRGVERQIYPNHFDQDNRIDANVTFYIPDRSYEFTVTGPGGQEKLYAIAVPERYDVVQPFGRFSREEPYPKLQAQMLLNGLRGSLQVTVGGQSGPARQPDRIGPQGIIVNPAPDPRRRTYEYAEDFVFYNVRPRGGSGYDNWGNPQRFGQIRVTTTPSNAVVYLNGERRGHSPLTITNIPYGNYRIYADKNGFQARGHWVVVDGPSMGYLNIILPPEMGGWRPRDLEGGFQGNQPGGATSGMPPSGGAVERQGNRPGGATSGMPPTGGAVERQATR